MTVEKYFFNLIFQNKRWKKKHYTRNFIIFGKTNDNKRIIKMKEGGIMIPVQTLDKDAGTGKESIRQNNNEVFLHKRPFNISLPKQFAQCASRRKVSAKVRKLIAKLLM